MLKEHETLIQVRYQETDAMARVHHANFLNYFELGRTDILRASGFTYRQVEEAGFFLVVAEISCRYFLPAQYDDRLRVVTRTVRARGATIEHHYEIYRDQQLLANGRSLVACVDREGNVKRLPDWLRIA